MKTFEWLMGGFATLKEAEDKLEEMLVWVRLNYVADDWTLATSVYPRLDGYYALIKATKEERVNEYA